MAMVFGREILRTFRFVIEVGPHTLGIANARWEGTNLILMRAVPKDSSDDLITWFAGAKPAVAFILFGQDGLQARCWRIKYERAVNRGFDFLDAKKDEVACEAVCLVNASAEAV
ncbi:MAG: hypothetical protein HOW73_43550 [Polyangiaceae bacterium]|nr:hypothetical protein [Polyangiaceae bacterium]